MAQARGNRIAEILRWCLWPPPKDAAYWRKLPQASTLVLATAAFTAAVLIRQWFLIGTQPTGTGAAVSVAAGAVFLVLAVLLWRRRLLPLAAFAAVLTAVMVGGTLRARAVDGAVLRWLEPVVIFTAFRLLIEAAWTWSHVRRGRGARPGADGRS